jgi:hypothetical protein
MITGTTTISIGGLVDARGAVGGGSPVAKKVLKQWQARYRGFAYRRFDIFSKGGGSWPPLAPATVKKRRKQSSTILRDKNLLFNALNPALYGAAAPGSFTEFGDWIVTLGYGGNARYTGPGSQANIADIARFHDAGLGVPKREIIVPPPGDVVEAMKGDANRAINEFLKKSVENGGT